MDGSSPNSGLPCLMHCFNSKPVIFGLATEHKPKGSMRNLWSEEHNSPDSCPISIQEPWGWGRGGRTYPISFGSMGNPIWPHKPRLATQCRRALETEPGLGFGLESGCVIMNETEAVAHRRPHLLSRWCKADPLNPAKRVEQKSKKKTLVFSSIFCPFPETVACASEEFEGLPDSWVENTVH